MKDIEVFLRDHAFVHTAAVAPAFPANIDYLVADLTDAQLRVLPANLNSFAWTIWHLARVEDACVSFFVLSDSQLFDADDWPSRLAAGRRDLGTGMTKAEVADFSAMIQTDQLFRYRDAVGRRTRALLPSIWPTRWNDTVDPTDIDRAIDAAAVSEAAGAAMREYLPTQTREAALRWWGLHHSLIHLGQLMTIRSLVTGSIAD